MWAEHVELARFSFRLYEHDFWRCDVCGANLRRGRSARTSSLRWLVVDALSARKPLRHHPCFLAVFAERFRSAHALPMVHGGMVRHDSALVGEPHQALCGWRHSLTRSRASLLHRALLLGLGSDRPQLPHACLYRPGQARLALRADAFPRLGLVRAEPNFELTGCRLF